MLQKLARSRVQPHTSMEMKRPWKCNLVLVHHMIRNEATLPHQP